jgi:hypothetical protein
MYEGQRELVYAVRPAMKYQYSCNYPWYKYYLVINWMVCARWNYLTRGYGVYFCDPIEGIYSPLT